MLRRLYLLFPTTDDAGKAATHLQERLNVDRAHIHSLARPGVDISMLPPATLRQRSDWGAQMENTLWFANLGIFAVATLVTLIGLFTGNMLMAIPGFVVALACLAAGTYVTRHIPRSHISDFRNEMSHGEVLLLVDVPRWRIRQIERDMRTLHPEMQTGGVGWGIHALGI